MSYHNFNFKYGELTVFSRLLRIASILGKKKIPPPPKNNSTKETKQNTKAKPTSKHQNIAGGHASLSKLPFI